MEEVAALPNTVGSVLDPVISLRRTFQLKPEAAISIDFVTGIARDRHGALAVAEKDRVPQPITISLEVAGSQLTPPELEHAELDIYGQLASALIYPSSVYRSAPEILDQNRLGPDALWRHGISGDLPIALLRILDAGKSATNFELTKQLLQAHAYWGKQGLAADLIILIEQTSPAGQELVDRIESFVASRLHADALEKPGGIFIRHLNQLTPEENLLFEAVARVVLTDQGGTLAEQLKKQPITGRDELPSRGQAKSGSQPIGERENVPGLTDERELIPTGSLFNNGIGGFFSRWRGYFVKFAPRPATPPPFGDRSHHTSFRAAWLCTLDRHYSARNTTSLP